MGFKDRCKRDLSTLHKVEYVIGYTFTNKDLLIQALTHRSYGRPHNERLEFLGDSILSSIVTTELYKRFPEAPEGDLTNLRKQVVGHEPLTALGTQMGIPKYIICGQGLRRSLGLNTVEDVVEALIGAIYLDTGSHEKTYEVVLDWLNYILDALVEKGGPTKDSKTKLQEYTQRHLGNTPTYGVLDPNEITVFCKISSGRVTKASGKSRRKAEQKAAKLMLEKLHYVD